MSLHIVKQNQLGKSFVEDLRDDNDDPLPPPANGVKLYLKNPVTGTVVVNASAIIVQAYPLRVQYNWQATDLANTGTFLQEWELDYGVNGKVTVPDSDYNVVRIVGEIA